MPATPYDLGIKAQQRGQLDDAMRHYHEALTADFNHPGALFQIGVIEQMRHNTGAAACYFRQALRAKPRFAEAAHNLGLCYRTEHDYAQAKQFFEIAIGLDPTPERFNNMGSLYVNEGCPEQALAWFDRALAIDPDDAGIRGNRGGALLELGRWAEAWPDYEHNLVSGGRIARTYKGIPAWDGSPNKRVIVYGEQGIGDEMMFASMIPDLKAMSAAVIFDCHPRLVSLFERSFGIPCHGTRKTESVPWLSAARADASVAIGSLGRWFRPDPAGCPGTLYLRAEPLKLPPQPFRRPRIGISWAGGHKTTRADLRTIPLERLAPMLKRMSGLAELHSVQYTPAAAADVCRLQAEHGVAIEHNAALVQCDDYDVTAGFVASLDLVISVCTTMVHLCGGLGVPCWVLAPSKPAWRYGLSGPRMPWYGDHVTVYRQDGDNWAPALDRVSDDLRAFVRQRGERAA